MLPKLSHSRITLSLLFAVSIAGAAAQDVTVSPVEWGDPQNAPDVRPALKGKPAVTFPERRLKSPEVGYTCIEAFVSANGGTTISNQYASAPEYVIDLGDQDAVSLTPGRRGKQPVNSFVAFAVIYNPRSASTNAPDATPRLLEITPVRVYVDTANLGLRRHAMVSPERSATT